MLESMYLAKCIKEDVYIDFAEWSKSIWRQMEDDIIIKDIYERHLYGFLYKDKGKIKIMMDAYAAIVFRNHQSYVEKGVDVSPIYDHLYWCQSFREFSKIKIKFKEELMEMMTPFMFAQERMKRADRFHERHSYERFCDTIRENGNKKEYRTAMFYGHQWQLDFKYIK